MGVFEEIHRFTDLSDRYLIYKGERTHEVEKTLKLGGFEIRRAVESEGALILTPTSATASVEPLLPHRKAWQCDFCGQSFLFGARHFSAHPVQTGQYFFSCDECGAGERLRNGEEVRTADRQFVLKRQGDLYIKI